MKKGIITVWMACISLVMMAQQGKTLTSADAVADILGDKNNTVTKVTIQTETDKSVVFQVEFKGFKDKDKSYKITATMLNAKKIKIGEFEVAEADLDPRAGLVDIELVFKQNMTKQYTTAMLETAYIQLAILDKKGVGSTFGIESLGIDSKTFVFNYKKKWKLKGAAGAEVTVKLTPYKSAATIKP